MKMMIRAALALLALSLCAPVSAPAAAGDKFDQYVDNVANPARTAVTVAPSDSTDLADIPKALYVGTGGNIAMIGVDASGSVTCAAGSAHVWKNVPSGAIIPFRPRRICVTSTTAADMLAIR